MPFVPAPVPGPGPAGPAGLNGITPISWRNSGITNGRDTWSVGCSSDGRRMVAADRDNSANAGIWTSDNSGQTWTQRYPNADATGHHSVVACDSTGLIIVCAMTVWAASTKIFRSVDGGATWANITPGSKPAATSLWRFIRISGNGQTIFAAQIGDVHPTSYLSTDGGATWSYDVPARFDWNFEYYQAAAINYDGTRIAVARTWVSNPSTAALLLSVNSGATWAAITPPTLGAAADWLCVAMSADGATIALSSSTYGVYVSRDSGATWARPIGASTWWSSVAVNDTACVMIATREITNGFWVSRDYGVTWVQEPNPIIPGCTPVVRAPAAIDMYGARFIVGLNLNGVPGSPNVPVLISVPGLSPGSGIDQVCALAKLTPGGADGTFTVVNGLVTAYTAPT